MAVPTVRLDGPYTNPIGSALTYTGHAGDGAAGDDHWFYVAYTLYRKTSSANVTSVGWTEMGDNFNAESDQSGDIWWSSVRWRTAVPSSNPTITVPAGVDEAYTWVAVYNIADGDTPYPDGEPFTLAGVDNSSTYPYNSDPLLQDWFNSDPDFGADPGPAVGFLYPTFVFIETETPDTPVLTDQGSFLNTVGPALTNIATGSQLKANGQTFHVQALAEYAVISDNYNGYIDYQIDWPSTGGDFTCFIGGPMLVTSVFGVTAPVAFPSPYEPVSRRINVRALPHQVTSEMWRRMKES